MRIERLDLTPYGRFADFRLAFSPTATLHVVLGRNEAGKTTMLEAVGDFLFGFPATTKYGFEHDQQLLRVGARLRFADGACLDAVRRKGRQKTLLDAAGQPVAEDRLRHALAGLDRDTFEGEFGLNQQGLRAGGKALMGANGKLGETLAAGSSALGALSAAQKRLSAQADELFTPLRRVSGKPLYKAVDRYTDAARALKAAIVEVSEWKTAEAALDEAKLRGIDLREQLKALDGAVERRKRAQRVRGKLAALSETDARLAALGPLPEIAPGTLDPAREALAADLGHRAELERLADADADAARALAVLNVSEPTIAAKAAIKALTTQIGRADGFEKDLPNRLSEEEGARRQLDDIARKLGLADATEALARQPTDADLARARALTERRARAQARRADAVKAHRDAEETLARLRADKPGDALDPARLKSRLDSFAATLEDAKTLEREQAKLARDARALADEAAALDPAVPDLDALARTALPDEAELARRAGIEAAAAETVRTARDKVTGLNRAVEAAGAELLRIEAEGSKATRADWERARAKREAALDRLADALPGPADLRAERFETVRALTAAADLTAERVLADADRAARLQALRETLAQRREEAEAQAAALAEAEADAAREVEASRALWAPGGVTPGPTAKMALWRRKVGELLARRAEAETRRADLAALGAGVEAARATLRAWLAEAGASFDGPFREMHRAAGDRLAELTAAWLAAREAAIARAEAEKTVAGFSRTLAQLDAEDEGLSREWPAVMASLGLRPQAAPEEALAALAAWVEVGVPREKLRAALDRIEKIRAGLAEFEAEAEIVVAAAAPDLAGLPGREAAARLAERLDEAEKASAERDRLLKETAARARRREEVSGLRAPLGEDLARLRETLGAADDAELEAALARHALRAELQESLADRRRELADSEGLDEAALRAEQAEFDPATLAQEIAEAEREQARLLDDYRAATQGEAAAQARLDALSAGRDAAGAARERAEAAGEIAEIGERWLLHEAAARLAARAIERHRAAAQDPLVARAGELFALATGDSFVGLGVAFDDNDNPVLVGRRAQGKPVRPGEMSEGARDQLYLSLRLALLERRAGEPIPFIGDDLLASFDDLRTERTLRLMAEFGARRQTILFTHHARVAELARGLDQVEVLEM
jgi:chromosome segregation protein